MGRPIFRPDCDRGCIDVAQFLRSHYTSGDDSDAMYLLRLYHHYRQACRDAGEIPVGWERFKDCVLHDQDTFGARVVRQLRPRQ